MMVGQLDFFLNVYERSLLCSPRLYLSDQKYSKNSNAVKYYFSILIYYSQGKLI